ncbi:uncharacterized protein LOC115887466 isoform X11 [Sitophilus oryzae]|uniref:Uncharacterized protein LOC115887466 isoform X11 n=1 Tax=Sitophilus oryzae TaxID=7048 RepID=A0A6J2YIS4_SITOR|nr:uncharacterized protein LOC115887466 isoform X11 [Sitophilus oryzae]
MTERCELSDNDEAAKQSTTSLQINNWCENEDNSTLDNTKQGTEEANDIEYCLELIPNLNDDAHSLIIEGTSQTKHENRIENLAANNVGAIHIGDRIYVNGDAEFTGNIGGSIYQKRLRESLENRSDCTKKVQSLLPYGPLYVLIICIGGLVALLILQGSYKVNSTIPIDQYVNRSSWNARPPTNITEVKKFPFLNIEHTKTESCSDFSSCSRKLRQIQENDMDMLHYPDVKYNFLIGGDGKVYEGRGWGVKNEMDNDANVALIGDFSTSSPSNSMIQAINVLIDRGTSNGSLHFSSVHIKCNQSLPFCRDIMLDSKLKNFI